jgi:hypothetical protein
MICTMPPLKTDTAAWSVSQKNFALTAYDTDTPTQQDTFGEVLYA